jgi:hypothetical protein
VEILVNKSHPALQRQPGQPDIEYSTAWDEFEAAEAFGWEAYWRGSIEMRAAMVGKVRSARILQLMYRHDTKPKKKGK